MSNDSTTKYDDNCEKVVMLFGVNIAKNSTKDDDTLKDSIENNSRNEISIFEDRNDVENYYDNNKQLSEFDAAQSSNPHAKMRMKKVKQWTRKEHKAFLKGLKVDGKGKWKHISKKYVMTKTPTQVASHAQKYFQRSETDPKLHKNKGQSIFDIKLHDECENSEAHGEFLPSVELGDVFDNDNDNDINKFSELHIGQSSNGDKIKKVKPWTLKEHKAFLKGLEAVGKGKWKLISKKFVMTKTSTQVASHAQKYFIRLETDPKIHKKKGYSIFDTKLHDEYENSKASGASPSFSLRREDILRQLSLRASPIKLFAFDECQRSANIKQSTVQRQLFCKED